MIAMLMIMMMIIKFSFKFFPLFSVEGWNGAYVCVFSINRKYALISYDAFMHVKVAKLGEKEINKM